MSDEFTEFDRVRAELHRPQGRAAGVDWGLSACTVTPVSTGTGGDTRLAAGRPTIRQVAQRAGVGFKTVARVVNGEPGVAPATAARVRKALDELNYIPDDSAGSLRKDGGRTRTIGLTISNVADPLAAKIHGGVEGVAARHNVAIFVASMNDDPESELRHTHAFLRRRVDGLILTAAALDQSYLQVALDRGTPIVFVDREPTGIDTDVIAIDNAAATAVAVRHLVDYGHRRIAHLGDRDRIQTAHVRRAAFRAALAQHAIPVEESLIVPDLSDELLAYAATRRLMEASDPPTAIHTAQNVITVGALRALRDLGLHHQVAVVGFDDIEQGDLVDPPITVIAQDLDRVGSVAAERLMSRVGGDSSPPQKIILPTQLIVRGSGEIRPRPL